ncbi:4-(cytidine 5'-diphospho)-2-C-methyl-D-erythritol kinase [Gemmatimonadota bacterium]
MVEVLSVRAPAKVNLALRILEREESGFHQLETLFLALEFCDVLRISPAGAGVSLSVRGPDLGPLDQNLVSRAARGFLERADLTSGVEIQLEKRIPAKGGLGGGSSDAAATLRGLQELHPGRLDSSSLVELAGGLGADVPFFLSPSPLALGWRRGDRILPLPPLPSASLLLAIPPIGVGTPEAFGLMGRNREGRSPLHVSRVLNPAQFSDWSGVAAFATNDFEDVVIPASPLLGRLLDALRQTGPMLALLSGSGSALFAVYSDEAEAEASAVGLGEMFPDTSFHLTRTLEAFPAPIRVGG